MHRCLYDEISTTQDILVMVITDPLTGAGGTVQLYHSILLKTTSTLLELESFLFYEKNSGENICQMLGAGGSCYFLIPFSGGDMLHAY